MLEMCIRCITNSWNVWHACGRHVLDRKGEKIYEIYLGLPFFFEHLELFFKQVEVNRWSIESKQLSKLVDSIRKKRRCSIQVFQRTKNPGSYVLLWCRVRSN